MHFVIFYNDFIEELKCIGFMRFISCLTGDILKTMGVGRGGGGGGHLYSEIQYFSNARMTAILRLSPDLTCYSLKSNLLLS